MPEFSLKPIAKHLEKLLKSKVEFLTDWTLPAKVKSGQIYLMENVRFNPDEEKSNSKFSKQLASLGDYFVNEAFADSHRNHASVAGITKYVPSYAGFYLEEEYKCLNETLKKAKKPFTLIVGGAKIDTKIGVLKNLLSKVDQILIGGALANTFLLAEGFDIGKSYAEKNKIEVAREIVGLAEKNKVKIYLPVDAIVASKPHKNAKTLDLPLEDIEGDMSIFDIGSITVKKFSQIISKSKTVIWNGPLGMSEMKNFAGGSAKIAKALQTATSKNTRTIIGGGDTVEFLNKYKINQNKFTHISTAGGAMLEFLEGKSLPGITALDK